MHVMVMWQISPAFACLLLTMMTEAMFSCPKFQNLALCKKKISRHIKLVVHA